MAISSLLLMGAARFLPALQRRAAPGRQQSLENELWQRVHAVRNICSAPGTAGERAAEPGC
jgi:prepilin peptidase dependent protein B